MSTWGQYTFEFEDKVLKMTNALSAAGKWDDVGEEIYTYTNLSGIFTDLVRGYMNDYNFSIDTFNDDVQIALGIIEKKYLQTFGSAL